MKNGMDYKKFVATWQKSDTLAEVVEKFKMKPRNASVLGQRLRKAGVPLKKFPPGKRLGQGVSIDYAGLAKLAKRLGK